MFIATKLKIVSKHKRKYQFYEYCQIPMFVRYRSNINITANALKMASTGLAK